MPPTLTLVGPPKKPAPCDHAGVLPWHIDTGVVYGWCPACNATDLILYDPARDGANPPRWASAIVTLLAERTTLIRLRDELRLRLADARRRPDGAWRLAAVAGGQGVALLVGYACSGTEACIGVYLLVWVFGTLILSRVLHGATR